MQYRISLSAAVVLLAAGSIHAAQARAPRASVAARTSAPITACSADLIGAEQRDGHGSCVRASAGSARVRVSRASRVREQRPARHVTGCGGALSAVRASSGAIACVASSAASAFQGFVSALEATGYRIDFMGGWRAHGSCRRCDMHPRGLAIDINQTGRNRVTRRFPPGVTALAAHYGLLHGAIWSNADTGHFELLSASPTRYAYAERLGAYASAEHDGVRDGRRHRVAALTVAHATADGSGSDMQGSRYR
jgi:hypothetical protein